MAGSQVTYAILLSFLECMIIFNYRTSFDVLHGNPSSPSQHWRLESKLKFQQKIWRSAAIVMIF